MADRLFTAVNALARQQQRGVYSLLMVGVIVMSLSALGVLAVGHSAWQKNQLQGLSDLVAMTAARQMSDGPGFSAARDIATKNGVLGTDTLTIQCIINNVVSNDCNNAITARVSVTRTLPSILPGFSGRTVTAVSEATTAPTVIGTVSSTLATVSTQQSALLNGLLTALGGGNVNLSVAQWGALLGSNITLDLLALQTRLGAATLNDLLNLNVSALRLLQEAVTLGDGDAAQNSQLQGILGSLTGPLNNRLVRVGDLLALDLSGRTNTALDLGLGPLAQATLLTATKGVGYTLPITSGLLNLDVGVRILEPPQVFVGRKLPYKDPLVQAKTAQVGLTLRIRQPLNINIALVAISALDMSVQLRVAGGLAEVNDLRCHYPRTSNTVSMTVVPSVADVCIAQSSANLNTTVGALTCGAPANILSVTLLGLVNTGVTLGASATLRPNPTEVDFTGQPPYARTVNLSLGGTLQNLLSNTQLNLGIQVPVVGGLLNGLLSSLLTALTPVLSPILGTVGSILDGLLPVLGVNLNQVQVNVNSVDCQSVVLTR